MQALCGPLVLAPVRRQQFYRHCSIEQQIPTGEHRAHSATA
jgi:hypothetical protein